MGSLPDSRRRDAIKQMFDLHEDTCQIKYETKKKIHGEESLELTKQVQDALNHLQFDVLNQHGKEELRTMIAIIFKEMHIHNQPIMICVANLLLIFIKPAEAFFVLQALVKYSNDLLSKPETISKIRW